MERTHVRQAAGCNQPSVESGGGVEDRDKLKLNENGRRDYDCLY